MQGSGNVERMTTIEIEGASPELRHELARRAELAGIAFNDFLLRELGRVAAEPVVEDVLDRIRARGHLELSESPADIIRQVRGD